MQEYQEEEQKKQAKQYAKISFRLDEEEINNQGATTNDEKVYSSYAEDNKSTIIYSQKDLQSSDNDKQQLQLNQDQKGSKLVFFVICLTNILINIDHGVVPAATQQIKDDLNINDSQLGFLGSLVYFGVVSAGFIAGKVYLKYPSKYIIIAAILAMVVALYLFTFITHIYPLYFIRFLTGAFQVFLLVYFPVWVDLHGGNLKTIWLTLLQVGVPLGVFSGYAITAALPENLGWRWAIYIQCISMGPTLLVFTFCNKKDIEVNMNKFEEDEDIIIYEEENNQEQSSSPQLYIRSPTLYEVLVEDINPSDPQQEDNQTTQDNNLKIKAKNKQKLNFFSLMKILWQSKIYVASLLAIALLYFVVTGIQFWMSDYFQIVLGAEKQKVFATYSFISLTGPTLGVIFGGILTQKIGGYDKKNAKIMCIILSIISACVACPMPFIDVFYVSATLVWLLLFFGGAMVPALTGMMLSAISPELRAFANSNSQTVQNLIGFLPAPSLYGLMSDKVDKRAGMFMLMYSTILGIFLASFIYLSYLSQIKKNNIKRHSSQIM